MAPLASTADVNSPPLAGDNRKLWLAALVVIVFVAWASFLRTYQEEKQLRSDMAGFVAAAATMDDLFRPYASSGNVWLAFQNFDTTPVDLAERWRMLQWYTRATYTFYPHRIFVAGPDTAVPAGFEGNPIPAFSPSPAWLAERQVQYKLTLRREPDNDISLFCEKLE